MDQTVPIGIPTPDMIARLPVPDRLSDAQRQGNVCVWGGEALASETAIDLGPRKIGGGMAFPRACRACLANTALSVLFDHASGAGACPDCQVSPTCEVGQALNRVIRMGMR